LVYLQHSKKLRMKCFHQQILKQQINKIISK
jgi:hypothetical protein